MKFSVFLLNMVWQVYKEGSFCTDELITAFAWTPDFLKLTDDEDRIVLNAGLAVVIFVFAVGNEHVWVNFVGFQTNLAFFTFLDFVFNGPDD